MIQLTKQQANRLHQLRASKQGRRPTIPAEQVAEIKLMLDRGVTYKKIIMEHPVSIKALTRIKKGEEHGY